MGSQPIFLWAAVGAAIVGNLLYHLVSRTASATSTPFTLLAVAYLCAFVITMCLAVQLEHLRLSNVRQLGWQPIGAALAVGVVLIEVGFLLAYRAGATLGTTALLVNATVAAVLLVIGLIWFDEAIDARTGVGLALTFTGIMLIASRAGSTPAHG